MLCELAETGLPRPAVLSVVRQELQRLRESFLADGDADAQRHDFDPLAEIRRRLEDLRRGRIQPVINGTGIIIHTNLGRSPLADAAVQTLCDVASNYNNLEFDLTTGERGGRASYLEHNLALLCGAEAATVVNNCAAALVLVLRHLAATPPRTSVVISRGELIQIGGGFRIPEILQASGATLHEIGTTNKTTALDYRAAINSQTAMILHVHRSNFYMGGFAESPAIEELAAVAREAGVPFVFDIGSGATFDTSSLGGSEREPTPADALARGADLVTFSGDKLFGGPQAGIIAGRSSLIESHRKDPSFRALRCDKLILAALEATVDLLLSGRESEIPIRMMMEASIESLIDRAERIISTCQQLPLRLQVSKNESQVGGGCLPRTTIPSVTIDVTPADGGVAPESLAAFAKKLRRGTPPVIGYVASNRFRIDLRTVFPNQDLQLIAALNAALDPS